MSNIRSIIQNKAKVFGKLTEAEMKNQLKALNYIELLAMQTKVPLSDWDVLNTFRAKHGSNKLVTNPKEINKRMFELGEKSKLGMQKSHVQDVIKHEKRILKLSKELFQHRAARYTNDIEHLQRSVLSYQERIKQTQENINLNSQDKDQRISNTKKDIANTEKRIEGLKEAAANAKAFTEGDKLIRDIAKIVMGGFWKFFGVSGHNLTFITANNIILFEKNPRAGLNLQKDMGVYKIKLNLDSMNVTVHSFYGNTKMHENIHPYVSQGSVCFGNSGQYFQQARNENDIVKMMSMLAMVLSTYSSAGGPHRRLADFRVEPNLPATKEAERYLAKKVPTEDKRLQELMQSISTKDVANKLAKTIGPTRVEEVDPDDEDDEEYDDDGYDGQ